MAAATTIWRGTGTLQDKQRVQFPAEDVGIIGGTDRSYSDQLGGAISFDSVPATFEQLPYLFEASIKTVGTGASDGTGSDKLYAYPVSTTSLNAISTYSIEGGDNQQFEVLNYAFVEKFKLSGKGGEAVMMQADWSGQKVVNQAKTGSLSIPTVEDILFGKGKMYIDDVSGTIGTTQVSNTLLALELDVTTGWAGQFTADNLGFSVLTFDGTKLDVSAKITFLHNSSAVTEKGNWRDQVARQLRLEFDGSALTTAGTSFQTKGLQIDLAGKWASFDKLGEQNGDDIIVATFKCRYDATAALHAKFTVANELSSLA